MNSADKKEREARGVQEISEEGKNNLNPISTVQQQSQRSQGRSFNGKIAFSPNQLLYSTIVRKMTPSGEGGLVELQKYRMGFILIESS